MDELCDCKNYKYINVNYENMQQFKKLTLYKKDKRTIFNYNEL